MHLNQQLSGILGFWSRSIRGHVEVLLAVIAVKIRNHLLFEHWHQCFIVKVCKLMSTCVCLMQVSAKKARMMGLAAHDAGIAQHLYDLQVSPHVMKGPIREDLHNAKT